MGSIIDKNGYKWQRATGTALALPDTKIGGLVGSAHPAYRSFSLNLWSVAVADKIHSYSTAFGVISGVASE